MYYLRYIPLLFIVYVFWPSFIVIVLLPNPSDRSFIVTFFQGRRGAVAWIQSNIARQKWRRGANNAGFSVMFEASILVIMKYVSMYTMSPQNHEK